MFSPVPYYSKFVDGTSVIIQRFDGYQVEIIVRYQHSGIMPPVYNYFVIIPCVRGRPESTDNQMIPFQGSLPFDLFLNPPQAVCSCQFPPFCLLF